MLIAHFCDYGQEQSNNRFNYLADLLARRGHEVELVTSSFSHRDKKQRERLQQGGTPYTLTLIDEPSYRKNVSLKRLFYSHRIMAKNLKKYLGQAKRPDLIYCAVPSLDAAYAAAQFAEKQGIPFYIDVQDLWPEAFQMVLPVKLLFAPWRRKANRIYAAADEILAVSQTYGDRALSVNHKCKEAHVVYLGTDLQKFDEYVNGVAVKDRITLGYCGTLGASYDIPCVLDALELLKEQDGTAPRFLVLGDGPKKEEWEQRAGELGLDVCFAGRFPYPEMCRRLAECHLLVNPIVPGAAQSIINKHADYAAAGKAVINTQECAEYRGLIEDYGCGINCRAGDAGEVAEAIRELATQEKSRLTMGQNARRMAEEIFDRHKIYAGIAELVERD